MTDNAREDRVAPRTAPHPEQWRALQVLMKYGGERIIASPTMERLCDDIMGLVDGRVAEAASPVRSGEQDSDELRKAVEALVAAVQNDHEQGCDGSTGECHDPASALALGPVRALLSAGDKAAPAHRFDHDGTHRHHHHDQTHEAVWWENVEQFGGEKREHRHGAGDKAEAPR